MKNKLSIKYWKEHMGIDYPYRLQVEGYNIRKWVMRAAHINVYPFSDEEMGFKTAWERKEMADHLKFVKLEKI